MNVTLQDQAVLMALRAKNGRTTFEYKFLTIGGFVYGQADTITKLTQVSKGCVHFYFRFSEDLQWSPIVWGVQWTH